MPDQHRRYTTHLLPRVGTNCISLSGVQLCVGERVSNGNMFCLRSNMITRRPDCSLSRPIDIPEGFHPVISHSSARLTGNGSPPQRAASCLFPDHPSASRSFQVAGVACMIVAQVCASTQSQALTFLWRFLDSRWQCGLPRSEGEEFEPGNIKREGCHCDKGIVCRERKDPRTRSGDS